MKKFIAPGSWFAFSYPDTWFEFSEEPDCFLFYNPEKWEGNFRISAYRDTSASFGDKMMRDALKAPAQQSWEQNSYSLTFIYIKSSR